MQVVALDMLPEVGMAGQLTEDLAPGKTYHVIGFGNRCVRILDEICEPAYYPLSLFRVVDSTVPESWILRVSPEGDMYADPPELSRRGFYDLLNRGSVREAKALHDYVVGQGVISEEEWKTGISRNPWNWAKSYSEQIGTT